MAGLKICSLYATLPHDRNPGNPNLLDLVCPVAGRARESPYQNTRIYRLSLGNPGDVKAVGSGISEMGIDYGPSYRIYFTRRGQKLVILLCGGDKSSQTDDILSAKALAADLED